MPTSAFSSPAKIAHYTCFRATAPLPIDGNLTKADWLAAPKSTPFIDIVTGAPAWFDTRVAMLWDDNCLYFGFTAQETDLWATLTERDSKIWFDNDLEIFIAGENAYYEFEINALNTIYEAFWIWEKTNPEATLYSASEWNPAERSTMTIEGIGGHVHPRGKRTGYLDWDFPHLRHAVELQGTLNRRDGSDRGWTAEIAFPWDGLRLLADGRSLPPKEGDIWRIDCSRFQHIGPNGERLDPAAGWTWNQHGHYDSHIPETFTYVHFSRDEVRPVR